MPLETKKRLIMPLCWPRFIDHYGHFMRDRVLYLFHYLIKEGLLDDPNLEINYSWRALKQKDRWYRAEWARMPASFDTFMEDTLGASYISWRAAMHFQDDPDTIWLAPPRWKERPFDGWGGDTADWPKVTVDKMRDYCFKKYNFKPEIVKRLLYVPRKPSGARHLGDPILKRELKIWCEQNDFEFVKWHNDASVSIFDQMKIYSESSIIVGCTGSDFTNSYWTSRDNLMIELIYPRFGSGFCAAFYSDSICELVNAHWRERLENEKFEVNWPPLMKKEWHRRKGKQRSYRWVDGDRQIRDWHHIWIPEEGMLPFNESFWEGDEVMKRVKLQTSKENRKEILDLLNNHVSHRLELSG